MKSCNSTSANWTQLSLLLSPPHLPESHAVSERQEVGWGVNRYNSLNRLHSLRYNQAKVLLLHHHWNQPFLIKHPIFVLSWKVLQVHYVSYRPCSVIRMTTLSLCGSLSSTIFVFNFYLNFFKLIFVELLYDVVLVSTVPQSDHLYMYKYAPFFGFPSHLGHHRALSSVPWAMQQVHTSYLYAVYMSIPIS